MAMPGSRPRPRGRTAAGIGVEDTGPPTRSVPVVDAFDGRAHSPSRRHRILPRSLLGIASLILALSVGAAFSGVILYSYYQYKLNQTNDRVNALISGYKKTFANAEGQLNAAAANAKAGFASQLQSVQQSQSSPAALAKLATQLAPSVFFVHTLDASGQASVGTAFVIASSQSQSLLLTDYTTIASATRSPGPPVYVRQGSTDTKVTVRTWDTQYDLALLVYPKGGLPVVHPAATTPSPQLGDRIYAVSGLGSDGASIASGEVTDVSASGLAEDAPIGAAFQGGPLVNVTGQVVAVASRTYTPLGFTPGAVWYAPYVQTACNKVLSCPGGNLSGATGT